jgi:hypothetical protein
MEMNGRIVLASILGIAVLGGALLGSVDLGTAYGAGGFVVTTSPGITQKQATEAFPNETTQKNLDLRNIFVFTKSGGSQSLGQKPQVLRVDMPVKATAGEDISFQYFVDVSNDVTAYPIAHCGDVRLHIYLDGVKIYTTGWMGYETRSPKLPLQTDKITIHDVSAGWKDIGFVPEGRSGGCNVGYVRSWGGTGVIFN